MYKPINGWTKQEIIDVIKNRPNRKSMNGNRGECMYRGKNGAMCAVGVFIPDEFYTPNMEHKNAKSIIEMYRGLEDIVPLEVGALLELQSIHDNYRNHYIRNDLNQELINWIEENVL